MTLKRRCGYCGEVWHSDISLGEQYKCGTIVCGGDVTRHNYCRKLCGEIKSRARQPRMKGDKPVKPPKKCVGTKSKWRAVREVLRSMSLGQTVRLDGVSAASAQKAYLYFSNEIPHRVTFRSDGDGCIASTIGDISNMEPGESRLYTDNLRHLMRRLLTLNTGALCGKSGEAYSFDEIEGVYWIRRVR